MPLTSFHQQESCLPQGTLADRLQHHTTLVFPPVVLGAETSVCIQFCLFLTLWPGVINFPPLYLLYSIVTYIHSYIAAHAAHVEEL